MKRILMIATGGTIASKNSGAGLAPALTSEELVALVPELNEKCLIETVQPFNLDSTNLYAPHWAEMAKIIKTRYEEFDGFVVTHGTDTMAYTAAALTYLLQNIEKPVVLTGSQKSAYLRDTDARRNLLDAFLYCADDGATGVKIVFDGKVIAGTRAKKTRTRSYNAFSSIDFPEIAVMREGEPIYYIREDKPQGELIYTPALTGKVFVLKMIPGTQADIFRYLAARYDGVVVECFGSGGLPDYEDDIFFRELKAFLAQGKYAVFTTQVEREGSALDKYEVGRRLQSLEGVLEARSMTLESTVTKLMWVLSETKEVSEVRRLFYTPIARDLIE